MYDFPKRPTDKFFSRRGCPLITQNIIGDYPLISVERYLKWYELYLINPDGKVILIPSDMDDSPLTWKQVDKICDFYGLTCDHSFYPCSVVDIADYMGAKIELQVYDAICRRYLQDIDGLSNVFTQEFFTEINSHTYFNAHLQRDPIPMTKVSVNMFPTDKKLKQVLGPDDIQLIN